MAIIETPLAARTLVYVAPRDGSGGVGDYATDFLASARGHFGDVVEIRTGGPGVDTVADVRRCRQQIAEVVAARGVNSVVVHGEMSGGSLVAFWALPADHEVRVTLTMHDPPRPVWYPCRTSAVARLQGANHLVQFPLDRLVRRAEWRRVRNRSIFVLSAAGFSAVREVLPAGRVVPTHHLVPSRPEITPIAQRPLAVGMFGHVYRGKGFERLTELRDRIDPAVEIRVAGRGTENLPDIDGVRILGPVEGAAEHEFFASVRMLLMPGGVRTRYGGSPVPASGVVARSLAYLTPMVGFAVGTFEEIEAAGAAVTVPPDTEYLATRVNSIVRDSELLEQLSRAAGELRPARSGDRIVEDFVRVWAL